MSFQHSIFFFGLAILLLRCDLGTEPPPELGIVWNQSVDGVKIRDDSLTVIKKLGAWNSRARGDFPGWILYYTTGPHAGINVIIYTESNPWGYGVQTIIVTPPYNRTTEHGIGLESLRSEVIGKIGYPSQAFGYFDWYIQDSAKAVVMFDSLRVTGILFTVI